MVVANVTDDSRAAGRHHARALEGVAPEGATVLLLGLEDVHDD